MQNSANSEKNNNHGSVLGATCMCFAYIMWGLTPLYTQFMEDIPFAEVVTHRILWSLPGIFFAVAYFSKNLSSLKSTIKNTRVLSMLVLSTTLLACHWGVFVYALLSKRGFETSLSFFITPILSIAMGAIILKERLNRLQIVATLLTGGALAIMTIYNGMPLLSVGIAITWSGYCFTRKTIKADSNIGFLVEMLILAIPALFYTFWLLVKGNAYFLKSFPDTAFLMGYGIINSLVFCVFSYGIKKTRLSTVGIMEYIAPIMILANTTLILKQPINRVDVIVFIIVFVSMLIYMMPTVLGDRK
ncbi:MAG: hypothetical protein C4617_03135 [Candidatus Liberibacter europaeus]|uniref:EamA domain-containing protein n=1 Tax=Candidatus Liberibacter europaeus TaxID=744859 RepID=A0A2T4VYE9_9HYPH|nr:hypothetical protein [Candidatus Liberibacter europaeus]PTL86807.1 MAG: hypothetical protein C4617_03135 [Candidatus Liberibacter europaeus]